MKFTSLYTIFIFLFSIHLTTAQQANNYDFKAAHGNGFRFWNGNDNYKIHMGSGSLYKYEYVQDYSIKSNMTGPGNRGWTWGQYNKTLIAGLNLVGDFQIAGEFYAKKI